ncbi:MAG TPA: phospholipase D family protein, partial [Chromatiaceae bacterium]|nr:phospholipase D family protein [Chromatiaceae bacterium]
RIFNPFGRNVRRFWQYITGFGRQTRRAHNKSYTVDNLATILGGRNIGDEYFERDPQLAFQDLDILALGPVAREVSASFDRYWNHKLSYPIGSLLENRPTPEDYLHVRRMHEQRAEELMDSVYLERLRNSELARQLSSGQIRFTWAKGEVFADDPNKLLQATDVSKSWMIQDLVPYLESARKELILISPYFVPGKKGVAFFRKLIDRGVKVRILTNSLASTDVTVVHAGYARYRRTLLRMGVELWELNKITSDEERKAMREGYLGKPKSSLHAKAFVVDRKTLFIGSMNFDPRSVIQNTEIGVVIETPVLARKVAETFDRRVVEEAFRVELLSDAVIGQEKLLWHGQIGGRQVTLETEPYSGIWRRLGILLMMWLPMVSQI